MKFAYQFSKQLKFFGLEDAVSSVGSWEGFMKSEGEIESLIKESGFVEEEGWITAEERERILNKETSGKIEPHLALFLSFLKLLRIPQGRLNNLTGRHLDFYYKEVLNLSKQKAIPDRVHLIFKLAKNASQEIVLKGSVAETPSLYYS
jgi:hypothetical protein